MKKIRLGSSAETLPLLTEFTQVSQRLCGYVPIRPPVLKLLHSSQQRRWRRWRWGWSRRSNERTPKTAEKIHLSDRRRFNQRPWEEPSENLVQETKHRNTLLHAGLTTHIFTVISLHLNVASTAVKRLHFIVKQLQTFNKDVETFLTCKSPTQCTQGELHWTKTTDVKLNI